MAIQQVVKDRLALLSLGAIAIGIILIVLAETLGWHWTKIFGAGAVTTGGLGIGVELGLFRTRSFAFVARIKALRLPISYLLIAGASIPMVAALLSGAFGLFGDLGDASALSVIVGAATLILMIAASAITIALTVKTVQKAFLKSPAGGAGQEQVEEGEGS